MKGFPPKVHQFREPFYILKMNPNEPAQQLQNFNYKFETGQPAWMRFPGLPERITSATKSKRHYTDHE